MGPFLFHRYLPLSHKADPCFDDVCSVSHSTAMYLNVPSATYIFFHYRRMNYTPGTYF